MFDYQIKLDIDNRNSSYTTTNYAYRIRLYDISDTPVVGTNENYIQFDFSWFKKTDKTDIQFKKEDGTILKHKVQFNCNEKFFEKRITVWILLPTLVANSINTVYMFVGDRTADDIQVTNLKELIPNAIDLSEDITQKTDEFWVEMNVEFKWYANTSLKKLGIVEDGSDSYMGRFHLKKYIPQEGYVLNYKLYLPIKPTYSGTATGTINIVWASVSHTDTYSNSNYDGVHNSISYSPSTVNVTRNVGIGDVLYSISNNDNEAVCEAEITFLPNKKIQYVYKIFFGNRTYNQEITGNYTPVNTLQPDVVFMQLGAWTHFQNYIKDFGYLDYFIFTKRRTTNVSECSLTYQITKLTGLNVNALINDTRLILKNIGKNPNVDTINDADIEFCLSTNILPLISAFIEKGVLDGCLITSITTVDNNSDTLYTLPYLSGGYPTTKPLVTIQKVEWVNNGELKEVNIYERDSIYKYGYYLNFENPVSIGFCNISAGEKINIWYRSLTVQSNEPICLPDYCRDLLLWETANTIDPKQMYQMQILKHKPALENVLIANKPTKELVGYYEEGR